MDVVRHHKQNWVAARAVIAVCGDVDPKQVRNLLNRRLKGWSKGEPVGELDRNFPPRSPRSAIFTAQRQQVHDFRISQVSRPMSHHLDQLLRLSATGPDKDATPRLNMFDRLLRRLNHIRILFLPIHIVTNVFFYCHFCIIPSHY